MKRYLFTLSFLIAILLLLPIVALAQSESDSPSEAVLFVIPPVLLGLMAANNRVTEAVKLYLASDKLPFTPPVSVRSLIVLVFSILFGIISAAVTPTALDWLGSSFHPIAAIAVTGFVTSLGAGAFQMVMSLLSGLGNKTVYETTTKVSVPPETTSDKTAQAAMQAASDVASKG